MRTSFPLALLFLMANVGDSPALDKENWEAAITRLPAGNFPLPSDAEMRFRLGWSGIKAGEALATFQTEGRELKVSGTGRSLGMARLLWRYDAEFETLLQAPGLQPDRFTLEEEVRSDQIVTRAAFDRSGVRWIRRSGDAREDKSFSQPHLHDIISAMLYVRSQPMGKGAQFVLPVFAISSPYLVILKLEGQEDVRVRAGRFPALRFELQMYRINKKRELEEHRRFRGGRIWVSADEHRIPLRAEVDIFIGSVFAELEVVSIDGKKE